MKPDRREQLARAQAALRAAAEAEGINVTGKITRRDAERIRQRYLADNPELVAEMNTAVDEYLAAIDDLFRKLDEPN